MLYTSPMGAFSDGAKLTQPDPISHIVNARKLTPISQAKAAETGERLKTAGQGLLAASGLPRGPSEFVRQYQEIAGLPPGGKPGLSVKA